MTLIINIKVVPSSGRTKWVLDKSNILKGYLKSPAQQGKANDEIIKTLANTLRLTQKEIQIVAGITSRNKKIKINSNITFEQILQALGIEKQLSFIKK